LKKKILRKNGERERERQKDKEGRCHEEKNEEEK